MLSDTSWHQIKIATGIRSLPSTKSPDPHLPQDSRSLTAGFAQQYSLPQAVVPVRDEGDPDIDKDILRRLNVQTHRRVGESGRRYLGPTRPTELIRLESGFPHVHSAKPLTKLESAFSTAFCETYRRSLVGVLCRVQWLCPTNPCSYLVPHLFYPIASRILYSVKPSLNISTMLHLFHKVQYQYSPVNGGSRIRTHYSRHIFLITAAFVLASAVAGFYAGRLSNHSGPHPLIDCKPLVGIQSYHQRANMTKVPSRKDIFYHNRTFGAAPSNVSDAAWNSIFPEQGGFFKHPVLAPQRSAWAVFHQLHCLVRYL